MIPGRVHGKCFAMELGETSAEAWCAQGACLPFKVAKFRPIGSKMPGQLKLICGQYVDAKLISRDKGIVTARVSSG